MLLKLFLAFTLIPVIEIYLFIKIGGSIGAFNTVALVIITGFAGAYLARMQGIQTMFRVQTSLQQGVIPKEELIDALLTWFCNGMFMFFYPLHQPCELVYIYLEILG